ncbi:hypothetical protein [Clostridium sp.]|jgi:hypothetical protein|uniref:hypothetical protein n=1 Tax=Clostridium sp. TaxID=1506 RepID=UPI002588287E|nr:hypothetical protein [Clostridium sp.]MDF2502870.1 hypothetical protein [Clostridium sp.]
MSKINDESHSDKAGENDMEIRKDTSNKSNTYKQAKNSDVLAGIKKCTKKYDSALKKLAK